MAKSFPHDPTENPQPSATFPSGITQEERGIRARLLLKLIDNGTIPSQPDHFVQELTRLAARALPESQSTPDDLLKALQLQFQEHKGRANRELRPSSPAPDDQVQTNTPPVATPGTEPVQDSALKNAEREDLDELHQQHPAVICQQLQKLQAEDINQRFKNLPGQTARQVAFLLWQDT